MKDEATAMLATWGEQWYGEPGQRIFSIVPKPIIEQTLPLSVTPTPKEIVRVFVHRAEILTNEAWEILEYSMDPTTSAPNARAQIAATELGRFAYGAVEAVAESVGDRTASAYKMRGLEALKPVSTKNSGGE